MFVGCQGLQGDDPPRGRGDRRKSLEIESRRLRLDAKDPRSPKRVGFIAVQVWDFGIKQTEKSYSLQSAFTSNVLACVSSAGCPGRISVSGVEPLQPRCFAAAPRARHGDSVLFPLHLGTPAAALEHERPLLGRALCVASLRFVSLSVAASSSVTDVSVQLVASCRCESCR